MTGIHIGAFFIVNPLPAIVKAAMEPAEYPHALATSGACPPSVLMDCRRIVFAVALHLVSFHQWRIGRRRRVQWARKSKLPRL